MTTTQKRHQPSIPKPEYNNLEVRCTWNGEYEDVSDIRIILEVECTPNTQLQLLSLRGPGIFYEGSYFEPLSDNEDGSDGREAYTPQSPLFGFSSLGRDSLEMYMGTEGSEDSGSPAWQDSPSPILGQQDGPSQNTPCRSNSFYDAELSLESSVESLPSLGSPCSPCSPKSEADGLIRARKRSASDAEFPDSGSDVDDGRDRILKDVTHHKARQLNSMESSGRASTSDVTSPREIALPRSPKKSTQTRIPGLAAANENAKPRSPGKATGAETLGVSGQSPQKPSLIPKSTSSSPSKTSPLKTSPLKGSPLKSPLPASFAETAVGYHLANKNASENKAAFERASSASPSKEPRVRFQLPSDASSVNSPNDQSLSPSPSRSRNLQTPFERLVIESSGTRNGTAPGSGNLQESLRSEESSRHEARTNDRQPEPFDEPEVKIIDGLVVLKISERVRPATYKVTVTAAMFIMYPSHQGWSDFELPGLPKTGGSKIGFILFLMPADHGLEIRTTNLNRASIVENCLVAEFINSGNLIIPLRRCERGTCGEISDFTVDQEIMCISKAKPAATEDEDGDYDTEMWCHALCFIRLYNRLFWCERCVITLYVDGGPEGFFQCNVTSQDEQTKNIIIQASGGTDMGVSRVQVTCSPKDMDRLYVRWLLRFPGLKSAYWLPRIYSTYSSSHELSKHHLRDALTEALNDPSYKCAGVVATEVDCNGANEPMRRFEGPVSTSDDLDSVSLELTEAFSIRIRLEQAFIACVEVAHFLKPVLIALLCLVFLRIGHSISSRIGRLSLNSLQVPEQANQMSPFQGRDKLFKITQDDHQETSPLNILDLIDEYNAVEVGEQTSSGSQRGKSAVELAADDEAVETSITFRDIIDYWLGWTGPV